ncbi:MAG: DUF1553 domain-containing protein [Verrucomicrobiales bacterium]
MLLRNAIIILSSLSTATAKVSFNNDIRPLLSNTCLRCHGPDENKRKAKRRLDTREGAAAENDGVRAIVAGNIDASELIHRITTDDPDELMPPAKSGKRFTPEQIALFKQWIKEGAEYETHWSYVKPVRPEIPEIANKNATIGNAIDALLQVRRDREGLSSSPEADRHTLIRRLSLDLTGLPPTIAEVDTFTADNSPGSYPELVDRLLAKPAFGEHWARMWLDLARYADSSGYADDPARTIWAYRDYVIRAFNENKPFDRFTIEQIAGDLLENPASEQLVATAFHRNTQTNNEGGTNDEEYRNVAIVDRVNTTMATWMGTTMACAQCHTHKYDPISQEEYFRMFAILNQTQDADRRDEGPTIPVLSGAQKQQQEEIETQIAELEKSLVTPNPQNLEALVKWEAGLLGEKKQWLPLGEISARAESGATFTALDDGSYLVAGKSAPTDTYTIVGIAKNTAITAVRLDVLSHESLSHWKGPGRKGNFVLNEIELVSAADSPSKRGRFVRIDLPGKNKIINIAEVQVFSGNDNVALKGKANQASTYADAMAGRAIDGNTDGNYQAGSVAHTAVDKADPFWEVDLGGQHDITRIVLWNRTDGAIQNRLDGFTLSLLDDKRGTVWTATHKKAPQHDQEISLGGGQQAVFSHATSSFDQEKFGVSLAIDGNAGGHSGWSVAPQMGKDHHAIFELASPLPGGKLQFTLRQTYGEHAIGRFRISVSGSAQAHRALPHKLAEIIAIAVKKRSETQVAELLHHFSGLNPEAVKASAELTKLRRQLAGLKPATTVPVMRELAAGKERKTNIQMRGNYLDKGKEVSPGLPAVFHQPKDTRKMDRLTLAKWLADEDNPLTARVMANRLWEMIFGIGIVPTSEEFGSQGELPTHPELLDWLAVEFMASGWDMKAFLKLLVTSAAYRQDSRINDSSTEPDPDNRLLARGPRFRLSAEMIRDQALAVSGLLSSKMYGAPVRPPQPSFGIKAAFGGGIDWTTSQGEDKYRRGLYTTWRRSNPYPSMATFDAPNRETCTVRRSRTNTPLQALVTLNDPVYIEAAQALARRMYTVAIKAKSAASGIGHGFRLCLSRPAGKAELARLTKLFDNAHSHYKQDPAAATMMATQPLGAAPQGMDHAQLAALAVVGNVLLNLDEFLMKR